MTQPSGAVAACSPVEVEHGVRRCRNKGFRDVACYKLQQPQLHPHQIEHDGGLAELLLLLRNVATGAVLMQVSHFEGG